MTKTTRNHKKNQGFKLRLLPVIAFTAVVLLIVRAHSYSVDIGDMPDLSIRSNTEMWDVFSYAKSSAILVISVWAGLTMAYLLITGQMKIRKTTIYIPMIIYTAGVLVSYAMSDYKEFAWYGGVERFEGTRTILCYMFMLFYTINVVDELRDVVIVVSSAAAGVFVACLIGLSQLAGHDFYTTQLADYLITGSKELSLQAAFRPGQVYQTVSNMNYVGMYMATIIPITVFVLWLFCSKSNREKLRRQGFDNKKSIAIIILLSLLLILIALNIYGANSTGSLLGIGVAMLVFLAVLCDKKWQKITILAVALAGCIGLIVYCSVFDTDTHRKIDYIVTDGNCVKISVKGNELRIIYEKDDYVFHLQDENGSELGYFALDGYEGRYQVDDARFNGEISIVPFWDINGEFCAVLDVVDDGFAFTFYDDGVKYYNRFGRDVSLFRVDSIGFANHQQMGSGRGFIWSRTIPLLKDRLFIGSGADTFILVFPQNDYAGKFSIGSPLEIVCDKPHNIFLNIAVGTGGISLLAYLAMIAMAMWKAFRLGKDRKYIKVLAAGIIGFLFAGLFNDSNVSIMPIFYGLLGTVIGMSI